MSRNERNNDRKRQRPEYHVLHEKHVKAILWNHQLFDEINRHRHDE